MILLIFIFVVVLPVAGAILITVLDFKDAFLADLRGKK